MAGAGKSTVGGQLARLLHWKLMDTDQLIEAVYGAPLQDITDKLGKEAFLDVEATVICAIKAHRVVLATGGSVVYRENAMAHLHSLGPIAYLDVPLPVILGRIARNPLRGLAIAPGQSVEDLFREREALYARYADCTIDADGLSPEACARAILDRIRAILPTAAH
jgi:shikimate kinase